MIFPDREAFKSFEFARKSDEESVAVVRRVPVRGGRALRGGAAQEESRNEER